MGTSLRLLMVEDSEDDAALVVRELRRGGYDVVPHRVDSEASLRSATEGQNWDLVICDFSMPHFSGMDALKFLRSKGCDMPFVFVSGTIGEETAVAALKMGAQDYIMKSNLKRLLPAVQRELHEVEQKKERRRLEEEVSKLQKFEAIGRLAGGIAHDFNNVLGVIIGWAHLGFEEAPDGTKLKDRFRIIGDQAERAAGLTKQLLAFARRQVLEPRNLNLNELISSTAPLIRSIITEEIDLKLFLADDLGGVYADPTQMEQVIVNLCVNARDAMPQGGSLSITTSNAEVREDITQRYAFARPGKFVLCSVSDTGTGMDAVTLDKIFEPFFTTKQMGRGTGLGLATVYGIVKQHNGFIVVDSELNRGTTFHFYLPIGSRENDRSSAQANGGSSKGTEVILIAEDHEGIRELANEALTADGYRVVVATNGQEALRLFEAEADNIRLVVLDVVMPLLSGPKTYALMREINPKLPVIFTTGHTMETAELNSQLEKGASFLQKPYSPRILGQTVRSVLDRQKFD